MHSFLQVRNHSHHQNLGSWVVVFREMGIYQCFISFQFSDCSQRSGNHPIRMFNHPIRMFSQILRNKIQQHKNLIILLCFWLPTGTSYEFFCFPNFGYLRKPQKLKPTFCIFCLQLRQEGRREWMGKWMNI